MTPRYNGKAGRTGIWERWADKQPIPPWRQSAPDPPERTRDWHNEHVREAKG